jgi:hypothetical protein
MGVGLVLDGRVGVDHEGNIVDVNPASSDIGCHQDLCPTRHERIEMSLAHGL